MNEPKETPVGLFFDLLKVATNRKERLSYAPSAEEWQGLYDSAKCQSLLGVTFSAVERLPEEQRPAKKLLLRWHAMTNRISERNKIVSQRAVQLSDLLRRKGYLSCVLKGLGVGALYPNPLLRQSGDIDVWVRTPGGDVNADRDRLIRRVRKRLPNAETCYYHIVFDVFPDVPVELHFMPTWLNCYSSNKRLQRWFEQEKEAQFGNEVDLAEGRLSVSTARFNAVYLLLHIMKHILQDGIGLRQFMDYYYLLATRPGMIDKGEFQQLMKRLGVLPTAQAVMYVLQHVFGLEDDKLLCEPNEKLGRFLVEEIMLAGNFGHSDKRYGDLSGETLLHRFARREKRALRFFSLSPKESLWMPLFTVYQKIWRRRKVKQ